MTIGTNEHKLEARKADNKCKWNDSSLNLKPFEPEVSPFEPEVSPFEPEVSPFELQAGLF